MLYLPRYNLTINNVLTRNKQNLTARLYKYLELIIGLQWSQKYRHIKVFILRMKDNKTIKQLINLSVEIS